MDYLHNTELEGKLRAKEALFKNCLVDSEYKSAKKRGKRRSNSIGTDIYNRGVLKE
jgi:hypothetical protein